GGLDGLPDGVDSLAPSGGRLPLESYASILPALQDAEAETGAATQLLDGAPTTFTAGTALDALWDARFATDETFQALVAAREMVQELPSFAGQGGERRYLVVAQNPAELRGTGGLWGAYAILRLRNDRLTISDTSP